ncbi:hypothetical protein JYU14_04150 [Simkania negevensis]|uniref:Uncharacterized protein n=1 Tax=Simkania negevensis TaxID=83561 RepID=A0ABS3AR87_9BACT|nr:hypothetical protein [Simkania negevensis]
MADPITVAAQGVTSLSLAQGTTPLSLGYSYTSNSGKRVTKIHALRIPNDKLGNVPVFLRGEADRISTYVRDNLRLDLIFADRSKGEYKLSEAWQLPTEIHAVHRTLHRALSYALPHTFDDVRPIEPAMRGLGTISEHYCAGLRKKATERDLLPTRQVSVIGTAAAALSTDQPTRSAAKASVDSSPDPRPHSTDATQGSPLHATSFPMPLPQSNESLTPSFGWNDDDVPEASALMVTDSSVKHPNCQTRQFRPIEFFYNLNRQELFFPHTIHVPDDPSDDQANFIANEAFRILVFASVLIEQRDIVESERFQTKLENHNIDQLHPTIAHALISLIGGISDSKKTLRAIRSNLLRYVEELQIYADRLAVPPSPTSDSSTSNVSVLGLIIMNPVVARSERCCKLISSFRYCSTDHIFYHTLNLRPGQTKNIPLFLDEEHTRISSFMENPQSLTSEPEIFQQLLTDNDIFAVHPDFSHHVVGICFKLRHKKDDRITKINRAFNAYLEQIKNLRTKILALTVPSTRNAAISQTTALASSTPPGSPTKTEAPLGDTEKPSDGLSKGKDKGRCASRGFVQPATDENNIKPIRGSQQPPTKGGIARAAGAIAHFAKEFFRPIAKPFIARANLLRKLFNRQITNSATVIKTSEKAVVPPEGSLRV